MTATLPTLPIASSPAVGPATGEGAHAAPSPSPARRARRLRRSWRVLCWVALSLLAAIAIAAAAATSVWGVHYVAINGTSMTESIPIGSLVAVRPTDPSAVRVGDVITFDTPEESGVRTTHRVIAIGHRGSTEVFRTKGDHNAVADPWRITYSDDTAWVVYTHVPMLGRLMQWLQLPAARMALVILPTIVLTSIILGGIWRRPRIDRSAA